MRVFGIIDYAMEAIEIVASLIHATQQTQREREVASRHEVMIA